MSLMGYSANDPGPASAPGLQRTKYDEDAARVVPFVDPSDNKAIVADAEPMLQPGADPRRFVVAKEDAFSVRGVQPPDVRAVDPPAALRVRDRLLTPKEQRAILEYEVTNQKAQALRRRAQSRCSRMRQITSAAYKSGVLGLDDPLVAESELYADESRRLQQLARARAARQHARREHIADWTVPERTHAYDPFAHAPDAADAFRDKLFPSKCIPPRPRLDTHRRVMVPDQREQQSELRQQWLRTHDTSGRGFNIVTGASWH